MHVLAIAIAIAALVGVLVRPFRLDGWWFTVGGALLLVATGALPVAAAIGAFVRGSDVYAFLIGMMTLAAFARREGVFAWTAAQVLAAARGSRARLLALVYAVGIITTALLSNDATIVVLTPAVLDAVQRTDADPVPYVVACALIANAASFLLPIANPSNLLFYSHGMPSLSAWFASFGAASVASIVLTFAAIALLFRKSIALPLNVSAASTPKPRTAAVAMLALAAAALVITAGASGPLGTVAFAAAVAAAAIAVTKDRRAPLAMLREISWPVVALTAGLFVLVRALDANGATSLSRDLFAFAAHAGGAAGPLIVAGATALASNLINNLPVGLDVGNVVVTLHPPAALASAALVGVNLGPNFTTNGSLATILWLTIVRQAGVAMSTWRFALIGLAATPLALAAAALLAR